MHGRSCCPDSALRLRFPDLVPVLPWLLWRGRCRYCGAEIPPAIPVVEGTMIAVVVLTALFVHDAARTAAGILLGWLLVLLVVADLRHRLLPDILTGTLAASGLLVALILPPPHLVTALTGAAIGGGSFLLLRFLYYRVRGIEGLGLGDVKLMAGARRMVRSGLAPPSRSARRRGWAADRPPASLERWKPGVGDQRSALRCLSRRRCDTALAPQSDRRLDVVDRPGSRHSPDPRCVLLRYATGHPRIWPR